jgi:hypothetical protein
MEMTQRPPRSYVSQISGIATADIVRADPPAASIAVSRASAFMTVARMPIRSPVNLGMPFPDICTPRTKLPPPTTIPRFTPSAWVATRSAAMRSRVGWWMLPAPSVPIMASPETLTITRR